MNKHIQKNESNLRALDPNVLQRQAANPENNVWVNASAGTGKTKVLTDRVLRLLLPDEKGNIGAAPHKILCLTFTKAAATEMLARINKTLGEWSILPAEELTSKLKQLLGHIPTDQQIQSAKSLFTHIINIPGGMKIMTIHAFCQSTLSKFPLEATLSPQATIMEDHQAKLLLQNAIDTTLLDIKKQKNSPLANALHNVTNELNEDQFLKLIQKIAAEHYQLKNILKNNFGYDGLYNALCDYCQINPNQKAEDIKNAACLNKNFDVIALKNAAQNLLNAKSKTDQSRGEIITHFLSLNEDERKDYFDEYLLAYLKKDNQDIRAKLATNPVIKENPEIENILNSEAERLHRANDKIKAIHSITITRDVIMLGDQIIEFYDQSKDKRGALDYNDLINKTLNLMDQFPGWVMYKMDTGIDHILVDEAQDTNPEQWQIIEKLCAEFFTHRAESTPDKNRTIFVVGDDKQSIYSFQRASPEEFARMHETLQTQINTAKQQWKDINLNISFRSTKAILNAVDAVFAQENTPISKKRTDVQHESFRRGQAGHVELWPLFENDNDEEEFDIWTPPITAKNFQTGSTKLAAHIAQIIKNWIDNQEYLPSHDRAVKPSDIMILVKSRTALVHQITRALKALSIPVNGVDRMVLNNEIAIQDLLALIRFTQTPNDDLNLACLLKSPLIGISEDDLFTLSHNRPATLWENTQKLANRDIVEYLKSILKQSHLRPYEFLSYVLNAPCPANEYSGLSAIKNRLGKEIIDPINELLSMAIDYEQNNIPALGLFYDWIMSDEKTIKRELEDARNQVRIMTVHGAKGLQSPIVIMPDTIQSSSKPTSPADRFLMPDKTGTKLPLYSPKKKYDHTLYKKAQNVIKELQEQEYNRLLYVAMTRAEDRLYIAGHTTQKSPQDNSWYFKIKTALESQEYTRTDTYGNLILDNPQTDKPDRQQDIKSAKEEKQQPLPNWAHKAVPLEKEKSSLAPSKAGTKKQTSTVKSTRTPSEAMERGLIIHKLLEILPNIPERNRKAAAQHITLDENIITETLAVINNPLFTTLFSEDALTEVPIVGHVSEHTYTSGIIDRLLITDNHIWLIDYKSGTIPSNVPDNYQQQMNAYGQALAQIYPNKILKAALLWTEGPLLMPVTIDPSLD